MKKFQKTFLFLFALNAFFLLLAVFLFPIRFLIPVFVFALILDIFLLFFMTFFVRKKYAFAVFPPHDFYNLNLIFEKLKTQHGLKNIHLLRPTEIDSACFYISAPNNSMIVISENILESFSEENMLYFLSYAFQKIKSGDALFLTVLSSFLFIVEKLFFVLSYPFMYFKKKKTKFLALDLVYKILSLMTRKLFYNNDRLLYQSNLSFLLDANCGQKQSYKEDIIKNKDMHEGEAANKSAEEDESGRESLKEGSTEKDLREKRRNQALFLWKLDSFLSLNPPHLPIFFAPVFLTNFLTNLEEKDYISLQPLIKSRVKNLVGGYPP